MNSLLKRNLIQEKYGALALHIVVDSIFNRLDAVRQKVFVVPVGNVAIRLLYLVVFVFGIDWV